MTDNEKLLLKHAHRKVSELLANKELYETKISYTAEFGLNKDTFEFTSRPSDLSIKAAVTDIRHFIAPKSPINMKTLIHIARNNMDAEAIVKIDEFKTKWNQAKGTKGELLGFGIELGVNEVNITRALLLDSMINGDILHIDKEKSELLAFMRGNSMGSHFTMNFIELLILFVKLLYYFDKNFISKMLSDE
jgi:hypothetical protein